MKSPCAGGSYQSSTGQSNCLPCPAGSFCTIGAFAPTVCPDKTFSLASADTCTTCPAGFFCTGGSRTACLAGTYQTLTGQSSCVSCDAGHFCPAGASSKTICAGATYSTGGASVCSACSAGSFCVNGIQNPCAAGTYQQLMRYVILSF